MSANQGKLYEVIAQTIDAWHRCCEAGNSPRAFDWSDWLTALEREHLPCGSGVDCGTKLDRDRSTGQRLVLLAPFHHMDANGFYAGWTDYEVHVRPCLMFGVDVRVKGRDRNGVKDYLTEMYLHALTRTVDRYPSARFTADHPNGG